MAVSIERRSFATTTESVQELERNTTQYGYPIYRLRVLFIRHGESQNNVLNNESVEAYKKHRLADPDLTSRGISQARACGRYLANGNGAARLNPLMSNVDAIYASPMLRTLRTAQPISEALGLEPSVWTDIHEVTGLHIQGVGQPGLTKDQMLAEFPQYKLPNNVTSQGWYPVERNKETRAMAILRSQKVADHLYKMAAVCLHCKKNETIALVCHGDFKDMMLQTLLGIEIPIYRRRKFLSYNTAITVVDVDVAAGTNKPHATLLLQNFAGHLDSLLVTHEALGIL